MLMWASSFPLYLCWKWANFTQHIHEKQVPITRKVCKTNSALSHGWIQPFSLSYSIIFLITDISIVIMIIIIMCSFHKRLLKTHMHVKIKYLSVCLNITILHLFLEGVNKQNVRKSRRGNSSRMDSPETREKHWAQNQNEDKKYTEN